ncbi:divalent cation tolerance protein CutA [bacterium]|nr:divalent cation tolerance protein CutA [bacterium]
MLRLIYATFPTMEDAKRMARMLVERKLAACVNLLPGAASIYRWEGKMEEEQEVIMVTKSTAAKWSEIETLFEEDHPHDVPALVCVSTYAALPVFADWVMRETESFPSDSE